MTLSEKIMDLSLIWKQAAIVFPYFDRLDFNWDEKYGEYLEKIMQTSTDREHYLLLAEFINLLHDGHSDLTFPKTLLDEIGYLPFSLLYGKGDHYVDGHRVVRINGKPMEEILDEAFRYRYHVGNYVPRLGQFLPLLLNSPEILLETDAGKQQFALLRQRPTVTRQENVEFAEYGDILYIRLPDFLRDRTVQIHEKLMECAPRAVILDIRENIGGMTKYGGSIAELFIAGQFHGCHKRTRVIRGNDVGPASQIVRMRETELEGLIAKGFTTRDEIERSWKVYRNAYCEEYLDTYGTPGKAALFTGPCVLLTSRGTVSAAEDFAAFFRSNRRAVLIGTHTCGTTGTPLIQALSAGSARICTVGYRLADGTEFIGKGIQPDIEKESDAEDIRRGKDTVLEYALEYLL